MSYLDRKNQLKYVSPSGEEFFPNIKQFGENFSHAAPVFTSPFVDGGIHQDMGLTPSGFNLSFEFFGADHDKEAARFYSAIREIGIGTLTEPYSKIERKVQPIQVEKSFNIINDIARIFFTVTFEEDSGEAVVNSETSLTDSANTAIDDSTTESATSFESQLNAESVTEKATITTSYQDTLTDIQKQIDCAISSAESSIDSIIDAPYDTVLSLVTLLQTPGTANQRILNKITGYQTLMSNMIKKVDFTDFTISQINDMKNVASYNQMYGAAITIGMASQIMDSSYTTKSEVITAITILKNTYADYQNYLDDIQRNYLVEFDNSDGAFIQNGELQKKLQSMITIISGFIFKIAFSLKTEYIFYTEQPTNMYNIAYEYYPDYLRENEVECLDFIEETNKLSGNELIFIPANRKMLVYI